MIVDIVKIGNSKGIRIPKNILSDCNIQDKVILEVIDKEIIIKQINKIKNIDKNTRENWDSAFRQMSKNGDDNLFINDNLDMEEWEWK